MTWKSLCKACAMRPGPPGRAEKPFGAVRGRAGGMYPVEVAGGCGLVWRENYYLRGRQVSSKKTPRLAVGFGVNAPGSERPHEGEACTIQDAPGGGVALQCGRGDALLNARLQSGPIGDYRSPPRTQSHDSRARHCGMAEDGVTALSVGFLLSQPRWPTWREITQGDAVPPPPSELTGPLRRPLRASVRL